MNHQKLLRLYREEKLTVRRRGSKKRALSTRRPTSVPPPVSTVLATLIAVIVPWC